MSMPAALDRYYTREEVLAFPDDGNRYELVHGELLVSPAPRWIHQTVVVNLIAILREYVRRYQLGQVLTSPADISFGGLDDVLVQPDVFVVGPESVAEQEWVAIRRLELVVEVLSPSTSRYDRFTKRRLYQEMQVPLYWIIDPDVRRAEVWTPEATAPVYELERLSWQPMGAPAPLVVELRELFEE
ncbi:MAG: Uma2 family endonuclease [Gemmatimonadaceae bacterium]